MKIAILETGRPPGALLDIYPGYPDMISGLMGRVTAGLSFETVPVIDNAPLPQPKAFDGIMITGSSFGVYDKTPWMDPLRDFIRRAAQARTPMVGICFGHQVIADALGGVVRKSEKGWGVGRHTYALSERRPWMHDAGSNLKLGVSHQDQVIEPPRNARTLASSAHTHHAMLEYADAPILSIQGHPEFADGFLTALYSSRRERLGDELTDAAIESLAMSEDNALVGEWMARFLATAR